MVPPIVSHNYTRSWSFHIIFCYNLLVFAFLSSVVNLKCFYRANSMAHKNTCKSLAGSQSGQHFIAVLALGLYTHAA